MSEGLERELYILGDDDETIYQMTVGEVTDLVGFDPDVASVSSTARPRPPVEVSSSELRGAISSVRSLLCG